MSRLSRAPAEGTRGHQGAPRGRRGNFSRPTEWVVIKRVSRSQEQHTGRRRAVDPTTCERDYSDAESEFMRAMERYKKDNRRPFPTWSEALEVLLSLGYRKVAAPGPLPGRKGTV